MTQPITIEQIQERTTRHQPITVLTAYDYPFAGILDECGLDMILVGDSLANVVLGLESTREVDIDIMVYHAQAVARAVKYALVVGDMPFGSYQRAGADPVGDARRLITAGCGAVKVEWFSGCLEIVNRLRREGIAVMGHIGLTPQTAREELGGFKVQGKTAQDALRLYEQAQMLEKAGCFSVVLECVPDRVAGVIARQLTVPVIGIGAGPECDGQVLVLHDLIGLYGGKVPRFVRPLADLRSEVKRAVTAYADHVVNRSFPAAAESFSIDEQDYQVFLTQVDSHSK